MYTSMDVELEVWWYCDDITGKDSHCTVLYRPHGRCCLVWPWNAKLRTHQLHFFDRFVNSTQVHHTSSSDHHTSSGGAQNNYNYVGPMQNTTCLVVVSLTCIDYTSSPIPLVLHCILTSWMDGRTSYSSYSISHSTNGSMLL